MLRVLTAIFAMFSLILGSNAWAANKQERLNKGNEAAQAELTQAVDDEAVQHGALAREEGSLEEEVEVEAAPQSTPPKTLSMSKPAPKENQAESADLEVLEFVLASKIENREPQGITDSFANVDDRAYAFARLNVKTQGKVTFVWFRNDSEYTRFTTDVQTAKKWRTYASVKLRPGTWKVQLLNEDNSVLAEKTFTLQ